LQHTERYLSKPIQVVYEDEGFMVFDKPAGLLVIPTDQEKDKTLVHIVNVQYASSDKGWGLHPCHRLDRETSGAIIFAKGKKNQKTMMAAFHRQQVKKTYIAFVHGRLTRRQGELKGSLVDLDQRKYQRSPRPKFALTRYRVREEQSGFSVVEIEPVTGRTNQIRIQFSQIGHPLVGERKYAIARDYPLRFRRTALHAQSLSWVSPFTKKRISVTVNLPEDMEVFLARNGNQRSFPQ